MKMFSLIALMVLTNLAMGYEMKKYCGNGFEITFEYECFEMLLLERQGLKTFSERKAVCLKEGLKLPLSKFNVIANFVLTGKVARELRPCKKE